VFPDGFCALFAPAAALPAWLLRPLFPAVEPVVVPVFAPGFVDVPVLPAAAPVVPPVPPAAPVWAKAAALESIKAAANPIAVSFMKFSHRLLAIGDKCFPGLLFQLLALACHLSAHFRASIAGSYAFIHVTDFRAVAGTLLADLRHISAQAIISRKWMARHAFLRPHGNPLSCCADTKADPEEKLPKRWWFSGASRGRSTVIVWSPARQLLQCARRS
jgi:hypothetical protein